jgi:hypothetical protein
MFARAIATERTPTSGALAIMATEKQIESNRQNALKSTGPRSVEGKARSRGNAYKHGLSGAGIVVEEGTEAAIAERKADWAISYELNTPEQGWTYHRLISASFQLDRADDLTKIHRREFSARAQHAWEVDRRVEAETIAAGLKRNPGLALRRLEATQHGAELLIERWTRLAESLEASGEWNEVEQSHALDLLGLPADLRNGRTPLDPPEEINCLEFRRELVADRIDRLTERISNSLEGLEDFHREHAEASFGAELSRTGQLIHRYEKEAWNRFMQARRELRPLQAKPAPRTTEARTADVSAALERQVKRLLSDQAKAMRAPVEVIEEVEPPVAIASEMFESILASPAPQAISKPVGASKNSSTVTGFFATTRPSNRRERRADKAQARRG